VRHNGRNVIHDVIEGSTRVLAGAQLALDAPREWSQIQIDRDGALALATAAHTLRFGATDEDGTIATPIKPEALLIPRRVEDTGRDLWSTFNVIQENTLAGGLRGRTPMDPETGRRGRRVTTRPIGGIDQDVKLNRALWTLADYFAKSAGIKSAV
jgi:hypothetical protein